MLTKINANIQRDNKDAQKRNLAKGKKEAAFKKSTKQPKTAKNFFKEKAFIYKAKKSISSVQYAKNILKDYVFLYYCSVRDYNPSVHVYLVQDNIYLYRLGLRYCAPKIKQYSIKFALQLLNLPNLHLIKRCFSCLKGFLDSFKVLSSSRELKQIAKDYIKDIQQHNKDIRRYIAKKLYLDYFFKVADKCLNAGGNNNFTA